MEREILHVNLSWWFPEDEDLVALRVAVGGGRRRRVRAPIGAEKVTTMWSRKHAANHRLTLQLQDVSNEQQILSMQVKIWLFKDVDTFATESTRLRLALEKTPPRF